METIRRFGIALVAATTLTAVPLAARDAEASCADLSQAAKVIQNVLNGACKVAGDDFDCSDIQDGSAKAQSLLEKWNAAFKNSNLTIGPRSIEFKSTESGTIIAGTKRTFISTRSANKDFATVTIKKRGGKAATVTICTVDARGVRTQRASTTFSADSKNGTSRTLPIKNVKGEAIVIQVDAHKMNKFAYDVSLSEK